MSPGVVPLLMGTQRVHHLLLELDVVGRRAGAIGAKDSGGGEACPQHRVQYVIVVSLSGRRCRGESVNPQGGSG